MGRAPVINCQRDKCDCGSLLLGAVIALLAALHKMLYASVLVNDDFMHRAYALQLLAGEWPIRDFFDYGMVLMYVTSALRSWCSDTVCSPKRS